MMSLRNIKRSTLLIAALIVLGSLVLGGLAYRLALPTNARSDVQPSPGGTARSAKATPSVVLTPTPTATPTPLPTANPATVRGIDGQRAAAMAGISWVRFGTRSCGPSGFQGDALRASISSMHAMGIHVLLTLCQPAAAPPQLYDQKVIQDGAAAGADAVQCGNEQMKQSAMTLYVTPEHFARFYDLCAQAVHTLDPGAKVILGSVDPLVVPYDNDQLLTRVAYLNEMQDAMNTQVHPGGNWSWRSQTLGIIDSWHNGYPGDYVNNLLGLLDFWANQLGIDPASGQLGEHVWIVEGTGCFKGCGLNEANPTEIAIAHILSLISDVNTALQYHVPFFYFSGSDFIIAGQLWPIGVFDVGGHPKPLRQDLGMGARVLTLSCPSGSLRVESQPQLLAALYRNCQLPGDYRSILAG